MPFVVLGVTGKLAGAYQDWIVGVSDKEEGASSIVAKLNAVAQQHGVLMPKSREPGSDTLPWEVRGPAVEALKAAGDNAIPLMDYDGVIYKYKEVPSLD